MCINVPVASRAGKGVCRDTGWRAVGKAGSFITSLEWLLMCKIAGTGFNLHIPPWCDQDCSEQRDAVVIKIRVGSKALHGGYGQADGHRVGTKLVPA